jgi:hypothetical protein
MKGRTEEAWAVTAKLHATSDTEDQEGSQNLAFAKEEFHQMEVQVTSDQQKAANETVFTLFTKPSYRKRMLCAFFTMFAAESTGILVVYSMMISHVPFQAPISI